MTFHPATAGSVALFLLLVFLVLVSIVAGTYLAASRLKRNPSGYTTAVVLVLLGWMALTSAVVGSGVLRAGPFPGVPLFLAGVLAGGLLFGLSTFGKTLAVGLPLWALIAFQSFRLPLELILHEWARQGTIPSTMTWTGQNYDVLTGILAIVSAPLAIRWRAMAWAFNLVGLALLINVARVAILSSPVPFGWGVQPPLLLALHLPYAWIGPACVFGALAGHVVLTRALLAHASESQCSDKIGRTGEQAL